MTAPINGPVLAPDIATYATRTPYLTATEFIEAGTGCDTSQLVPGGSPTQETAALTRVIGQASSWADSLTYKVLAATLDVQAGRYLARGGILSIPVKFSPLIAVTSVSVGEHPWSAAPLADLSRAGIIPPNLLQVAVPGCLSGRRYVAVSYVNGWTNTALAAPAAVGAQSLTLGSNLGVYPGQLLTVDDGATTEQVQVAPSYVFGTAGPVPLAAPCTNPHNPGAAVTALPPDIKRAVTSLTACLIKTRGAEALVMGSIGSPPSKTAMGEAGALDDYDLAADLLERYRRTW